MNRPIHFEIQADNLARAKKFYSKVFGWKIEKAPKDMSGGMDYWMVDTGEEGPGINGGMYERPKRGKTDQFACTIGVSDIKKAVKAVKDQGGTIVREPMDMPGLGWFAQVKDPEGNNFTLMQPTEWKPR